MREVCLCVCINISMCLNMCVCCGMCEITDIEDPWGNPLPESFILQAGKLWRKHFIPLKLQALKCERLIDSSIQAELTPSFRLNALPLWGWISLSCLWLNLMVECVHKSLPFCRINAPFISEMCCLWDKMRSEMKFQTKTHEGEKNLRSWMLLICSPPCSVVTAAVVPALHP